MENNDNKRKLYDALSKDYDMGSFEQFSTDIQDETKRKKLYDATSKDYDFGDYDKFSEQLGFGKQSEAAPVATESTAEEERPLTEEQKQEFAEGIGSMQRRVDAGMKDFNQRVDNIMQYGVGLDYGQTKKGKQVLNPTTGKLEQTYLTPTGESTTDKAAADRATFQFRQRTADMTVGGQLRNAEKQRAEIIARMNVLAKELDEKNDSFLRRLASASSVTGGLTYNEELIKARTQDGEYAKLHAALTQVDERIATLKDERDRQAGKDVGFWRGFGKVVSNPATWDMGYSDLTAASAMLQHGKNDTEGEAKADEMMMQQTYENQQVQSAYGGNAGFLNRAGIMFGHMPAFAIDFAVTLGGYSGLNFFGKAAAKGATKAIGKEVVEEMAKEGFKSYVKKNGLKGFGNEAANWTVKALGTTADDLLVRAPLMTNTVQGQKVAADVIDRKLGDVVVDENGNYDFSNDKSWGSAIWQGEANAVIENFSEMFGTHIDDVVSLGKIADVLGAKRISGMLSKANNSSFGQVLDTTKKQFEKLGVSDYLGEVTEEYYGQLWRTMLNLDDAYQQNADGTRTNLLATGQFHGDIWGGMALSMGLMGTGRYGISAANYGSMKHQVNVADRRANQTLSPEVWEPLRTVIDNTSNEDIGVLAERIINDSSFTEPERDAVMGYMERSLNLRGYNLGNLAKQRGSEANADEEELNQSYMDGYNASTPQEMNNARNMYEYQRERVSDLLSEETLAEFENNPVESLANLNNDSLWDSPWTDEEKRVMTDYLNAKMVYDGMLEGVRNSIDEQIAASDAMIDGRVNKATGMIQPATMKVDDRRVYIVSGSLALNEDGTIDHSNSDESIIIRDAETGALEFSDPASVFTMDAPIDAMSEKEAMRVQIRESQAQEAADKIDGVLSFTPGDVYSISDGQGGVQQISIVGDAMDEQGVPLEGQVVVQIGEQQTVMPREEIQALSEAASLESLNAFEQERAAERQQAQEAALEASRPQYRLNDEVSLMVDGVPVRGSITAEADADGRIEVFSEEPINGNKVNLFTREELDALSLSENNGETTENDRILTENDKIVEGSSVEVQPSVSALSRIPLDEQGQPMYEQTDADTAWDAIVEQTEGDEDTALSVAESMLADKEAALKKAEKAKPKSGVSIAEKIAAEKERKEVVRQAQAEVDIWKQIVNVNAQRKEAARKEQEAKLREEQAKLTEQAIIDEKKRKEEEAAKAAAQAEVGTNNVAPSIREKWTGATKVEGAASEYVLPNGEKITGHYVLVESGAASASHDAANAFAKTEGFPVDENGQSVNDRDYERDADAQNITRQIAANYDSRAVQTPVVVSQDGVVLSGNGRTMAGELAAAGNTDAAYIEHIGKYAGQYGFTPEQVASMQHPRVVFVPDDAMPYTAETFAKFNQQEMKGQSKTEQAVKFGKVVDDATFNRIVRKINAYDTLGDFYADTTATAEAIKELQKAGVLVPAQITEMFDGDSLSARGREVLENMLIGKAFESNPDAVRQITAYKSVRQSIISALAEISNNIMLGSEYSLESELSQAIALVYAARQSGIKQGEAASSFARQGNLFQLDEGATIADYQNATVMMLADILNDNRSTRLKKTLSLYNNQAADSANGQMDLFSGSVESKQDIINQVNQLLNNGTEAEQQTALDEAAERRKEEASVQQNGDAGTSDAGSRQTDALAATEEVGVSEEKLLDYKRRTEKAIAYVGEHIKLCNVYAISNESEIRDFAKYGVGEEYIEKLIGELHNPSTGGIYVPEMNAAFIWVNTMAENGETDSGILRNILHEQIHSLMKGGLYSEEEFAKYADMIREAFPDIASMEREVYSKQDQDIRNEEVVAIYFGSIAENGMFEDAVANNNFDVDGETPIMVEERLYVSNLLKNRNNGKQERRKGTVRNKDGVHGQEFENRTTSNEVRTGVRAEEQQPVQAVQGQGITGESEEGRVPGQSRLDETTGKDDSGREEVALSERVNVQDNDWTEGDEKHPTYKRTVMIDGVHEVTQVDAPDSKGYYTGSHYEYDGKRFGDLLEVVSHIDGKMQTVEEKVAQAEAETDTHPTDAQKEAGNYKKGHVKIDGFNVTIENPKGSERSGTDASGNKWSVTMNNTYGYIRGTEGVDGDHIDLFLSETPSEGDVFVVDQVKADGSFDEHKVMYGFPSVEAAREAYLANYSPGWKGLGNITHVSREEFKKWVESSHRKTKPFAEYKSVKPVSEEAESNDIRFREESADHIVQEREMVDELDHKQKQLEIVQRENPMQDDYHTGIRKVEDIKSFDEVVDEVRAENREYGELMYPDTDMALFEDAAESGMITVYSSKPIKNGTFVSPSRMNAEDYAGGNRVYYARVPVGDVAWIDGSEGVFASVSDETPNVRFRFINEHRANLDAVSRKFNEELERYSNGEMGTNEMFHLGMPAGVMENFLPNLPIVMRPRIINKASHTKHNVEVDSLRDLPTMISSPIFVFKRSDNALGMLTEIKDRDGKNVCVAIELNKTIQDGGKVLEVNDVRSIHGRDEANLIKPIAHNETLVYADKKKGLEWLSSASSNYQQEIDIQDLNSATKIVENFENPTVEQGKITSEVENLADKLNTKVRIARSVEDVPVGAAKRAIEKGRKVKAWFDTKTGEVVLYLPNATSVDDAIVSVLHEVVAHKGLRDLFGKNFDTFLDNVYANASEEIRKEIAAKAAKYGWDFRTATEEYLAELAGRTDFENVDKTWWQKVKELFTDLMHKIGIAVFNGDTLTDNELRYILWRSYENLKNPNGTRDILGTAKDVAMQSSLEVGNYSKQTSDVPVDSDIRFRVTDSTERAGIIRDYDKALKSGTFKCIEAFQDSMRSVKVLMSLIEKETGKPARSFEDVYKAENQLSSRNKADHDKYLERFLEPLLKKVGELADKFGRDALEDYIYAKSGLERNDVMKNREAEKAREEYESGLKELEGKLANGEITQKQFDALKDQADKRFSEWKPDERDYSGLTALVLSSKQEELDSYMAELEGKLNNGDISKEELDKMLDAKEEELSKDFKEYAERIVSEFEATAGMEEINSLWEEINSATQETLRNDYRTGMISTETYNEVKGMMKYYVPMRGWAENNADDEYDYYRKTPPVQANNKNMKGRRTRAYDPIPNIAMMAQSSIIRGNRNKMKQRFFNFIVNRPTELASIRDVWYVKQGDSYQKQAADIREDDTPDTIIRKIEEFEERMKELEAEGNAYRGKLPFGLDLKFQPGQQMEHVVRVMINGKEYGIYINGNPRAAQAINGLLNPEAQGAVAEWYNAFKRYYSAGITSWSPDFVAANFARDSIHSTLMTFLDKGPMAAAHFLANVPKSIRVVARGHTAGFDKDSKEARYFREFIENGGETGYTAVNTQEDYKREYEKAVAELSLVKKSLRKGGDGFKAMVKWLEVANRIAEDVNRFNAYMSSRESGLDVVDSVDAAKNITVNFNKKGALGNTKGFWGALAWFLNTYTIFFNPTVQGMYQIGKSASEHKSRAAMLGATMIAVGALIPYLNELLVESDGDDDDDYWLQNEYTRKNNLLLFCGKAGGYVKIPLPPTFRELYGMGDIFYRAMNGRITPEQASVATLRQMQLMTGFLNVIPDEDPSMGKALMGAVTPEVFAPVLEVALNRDFMGRSIAKQTEYNKYEPEFKRVYKGVNPVYVELSRTINKLGGGYDVTRVSLPFGDFINPAYIEHIVTGYTGGLGRSISNVVGWAVNNAEGKAEEFSFRNYPIVNRFFSVNDESALNSNINRQYYEYRDRAERLKHDYKGFLKEKKTNPYYKKEVERMKRNGELKFFRKMDGYEKAIYKMQKALKANPDNKKLEQRILDTKAKAAVEAKKILEGTYKPEKAE